MSGPGEIGGPMRARSVVTPINVISQPLMRSSTSLTGRRNSSQTSNAKSERTKKYAPQPRSRNSPSAALAPERPQALAGLDAAGAPSCVSLPADANGERDRESARSAGWYVIKATSRNSPSANSASASTSRFLLRSSGMDVMQIGLQPDQFLLSASRGRPTCIHAHLRTPSG